MPHFDLLELPYFREIPTTSLITLIDALEPIQFTQGSVIINQDQKQAPPLYIATHGKVALIKNDQEKKQRIIKELDAPTLLGEVEFFCQIAPTNSITTLTNVSAFILKHQIFNKLFKEQNPAIIKFAFNIVRLSCHKQSLTEEMLARALSGQDLLGLRRSIFSKIFNADHCSHTTRAFTLKTE